MPRYHEDFAVDQRQGYPKVRLLLGYITLLRATRERSGCALGKVKGWCRVARQGGSGKETHVRNECSHVQLCLPKMSRSSTCTQKISLGRGRELMSFAAWKPSTHEECNVSQNKAPLQTQVFKADSYITCRQVA